jgi:hypothetical protein
MYGYAHLLEVVANPVCTLVVTLVSKVVPLVE